MPPPTRKPRSDRAFGVKVEGRLYVVEPDFLPPGVERELFNQSGGLTLPGIVDAFERRQFAPFLVAALVFLGRRANGEMVTYPECEAAVTYTTDAEFIAPDELENAEREAALPPPTGES